MKLYYEQETTFQHLLTSTRKCEPKWNARIVSNRSIAEWWFRLTNAIFCRNFGSAVCPARLRVCSVKKLKIVSKKCHEKIVLKRRTHVLLKHEISWFPIHSDRLQLWYPQLTLKRIRNYSWHPVIHVVIRGSDALSSRKRLLFCYYTDRISLHRIANELSCALILKRLVRIYLGLNAFPCNS